ncbi:MULTISPECIES: FAD-binding oxidoreductase [unclassified Kaistella]|nr:MULTISPECIES: FAD-dependent oxidoreductase [unclassified Kaistella]MDP2453618.1 FAD-dependent oxidoreductase [Kaistella sp. SH11-4b]MDP2456675.1 FAD-dependent oxidoreductase [Kaistella sp. SH40-3]MDP2459431.1 FAD-dependent oxidoreductase [Kaistella sp. SH19-2b]
MKNVDYIIVGDGYAAYFFAHQLILHQKSFVLFSSNKKSASRVSAGIVNPLVLKKFTTFWLAAEQIEFLTKTLAEIESYTGKNYLINERIHRIFHDENEKTLWSGKTETDELKSFLNPTFETLETIKNPFGTGEVNHSARLEVNAFFEGLSSYLEAHDMLIHEEFDYTKIQDSTYKNINFKNIVFCEGMAVRANPFFNDIQVIANKGHHLKVKLSQKMNHHYTLKKKHFLFPLNDDVYYYGGTYDPNERGNEIDDFKTEELITGLSEFYPHDFEIEEVNYGFRPTVKDRRPILGNHPDHQNYYIYNGLGARGILNGCYFSKELYEHIENGKPLMAEVDIKRFNK